MIGEGEEPSGKKTSRCKCVCLTILIIVAINFGIFYRQEIYDQFSKLKAKLHDDNETTTIEDYTDEITTTSRESPEYTTEIEGSGLFYEDDSNIATTPKLETTTDLYFESGGKNDSDEDITTMQQITTAKTALPNILDDEDYSVSGSGNEEALTFQPEFAEPIVNISVAIGRDATFTCNVKHLGGYRVGWVKADTKAIQAIHDTVITHNSRVTVSHLDVNTWNLHIKSVNEEDRGGYMCQINTDPMKSQIGYLDVVIPPDFIPEDTSSDVIVPEGSSVKLTCRARGYPEPVVTWRREDGTEIILKDSMGTKTHVASFRGEVLKLTKIARNEMGSYLCIASNSVPPSVSKRISLNIHFHPVIHVPNQLVGAPLGTDVQIECHVEASPKSINYWIKDSGEMIVSSSKYIVQEHSRSLYEMKMSVTVKKFEKDDVGSYRCIAKNSLGEVDSSIRLYEIPGPTRKVPPSNHDNEFQQMGNKKLNQQGKESHFKPPKVNNVKGDSDDDDDDDFSSEYLEYPEKRDPMKTMIQSSGPTKKPNIQTGLHNNGNNKNENDGALFSRAHHLTLNLISSLLLIICSCYSHITT